ncbi:nucleotidyl transferase AbiEii/AbiGii toxin family protein [Autumnicola psychrophila]|uniref:Nucleotidyl transferase AbiEii/AbiGii toxin family protein n=1 Tax=Autumnicola psychrophila TaxID=3075592 RepID=A0ABU3DVD0_9FLAO|nr:nucleotidyl transferase AbiEii/AbiGii toxin family protein [Zunongwangia sp. F225]MDT0687676.1 nucleotidyl transferase AbiEii/AbiGii toxin family protein [Zunongwangia sp. F225]
MNLHKNRELLEDAILATAEYLEMREIYVEKDYWVTVALHEIFHSDIASQAVFKGGTALSKCHKLIERFSEDIDLVVLREEGENDNQLKRKIRKISKIVEKEIPEIEVKDLTKKRGNIRKTVHQYAKIFDGDFGQVREHVVLEATWLGNFEPYSKMHVSSYIYEMMKGKGQEDLIAQYSLNPFTLQVLSTYRTFCEKIMSLVRFSRSETPIIDLRNKIRHIYDIHQMLKDEEIHQFFKSSEFNKMLVKVGEDDMIGYKNNNEWLAAHPATALIFDQPKDVWVQLSPEYKGNFRDLVTGNLPEEEALVETLRKVGGRLKAIEWKLNQN